MSKSIFHKASAGKLFQEKERVYPTGCKLLNVAFGVFDPETGEPGIPAATVVEAFGPNASLKTALWESLAANIHRIDQKAKVLAILSEEPEYKRFESVGIDLDRLFCWTYYNLGDPEAITSAEEGLNLVNDIVSKDTDYKLVVVDSIKGLMPQNQTFDKKSGFRDLADGNAVGARANMMNNFTGQFAAANKARAILFMVNQTSESIGTDFMIGSNYKTKTAGGRGKEHWAKIRIRCNSTAPDQTDKPQEHSLNGNKIFNKYKGVYHIEKNKFGFPFRTVLTEFDLLQARYLNEKNCLSVAEFLGLVERRGNAYWKIGEQNLSGRVAAEQYLVENPDIEEDLWKEIGKRHVEFYGTPKARSAKEELESAR
jgi:RecA/RadA recombinase